MKPMEGDQLMANGKGDTLSRSGEESRGRPSSRIGSACVYLLLIAMTAVALADDTAIAASAATRPSTVATRPGHSTTRPVPFLRRDAIKPRPPMLPNERQLVSSRPGMVTGRPTTRVAQPTSVPAQAQPARSATSPAKPVGSTAPAATRPVSASGTRTTTAPEVPASLPVATSSAPSPETKPALAPAPRRATASRPVVHRPAEKPDILLITASNLPLAMTGFGGDKTVKTPNLDRLAAEGALFTRFYTPTPQAGPARGTLLTGQYPHRHGVTTDGEKLFPRAEAFTERLNSAGYRCAVIGPWDFAGVAASRPAMGFVDYPAVTSQPWAWTGCDVWINGNQARAEQFLTDWITDEAIHYLAQGGDKPSFLWVSYHAPGEPAVYPPGKENLYPPASIELPKTYREQVADRPSAIGQSSMSRAIQQGGEQRVREARSKYYAMLAHLDEQIGRLLGELERFELRNRTIVVFASEVGIALGDHQLLGVGPAFYDELIRCPLVVSVPGTVGRNAKVDRVVGLVDLAPTLLQFAGLPTPIIMQGRSLAPLMADPDSRSVADECFLEYERQQAQNCQVRGLVVRNFKYLNYISGTDALYDLGRDPTETHNVVQQLEYKPVVDVLKNRLQQWQRASRDPLYHK